MEVKPTRSELMKLKNKIKLAKSGHKLLKKKRDGLILEFFEIIKKTKSVRQEMSDQYKKAKDQLTIARVNEGDYAIRSIALSRLTEPEIELETKNIMGVVLPKITSNIEERSSDVREFGFLSRSIGVMEATQSYQTVLEYILLVAEIETGLKRLLDEIERTKRRANALEYDIIPKLEKLKSFIELRLEEQERETIFRTKKIKKKKKQ
ncbi:MAG: V-type ATP synthase subunit D [Nanoarchaeota archaeon]|nr:V-type ATP synthase subunit D [Nanoarchaeota archaeon]